MNFTAISLSLIWNSPIYCICADPLSYSCKSACSKYGFLQLSSNQSILDSLKYNINQNISFALFDDNENSTNDENIQSKIYFSMPEQFFLRHYFTIFSISPKRVKATINILSNIPDFDYYPQLDNSSFHIYNVDLTLDFPKKKDSQISNQFTTLLSLHNSSIPISENNYNHFSVSFFELDTDSLFLYYDWANISFPPIINQSDYFTSSNQFESTDTFTFSQFPPTDEYTSSDAFTESANPTMSDEFKDTYSTDNDFSTSSQIHSGQTYFNEENETFSESNETIEIDDSISTDKNIQEEDENITLTETNEFDNSISIETGFDTLHFSSQFSPSESYFNENETFSEINESIDFDNSIPTELDTVEFSSQFEPTQSPTNDKPENETFSDTNDTTVYNTHMNFSSFVQFEFREVKLHLNGQNLQISHFNQNSILIENSDFRIVIDYLINKLHRLCLIISPSEYLLNDNLYQISINGNNSTIFPMHFDFSQIDKAYIKSEIKNVTETNLVNILSFNIASNTFSITKNQIEENNSTSNETFSNETFTLEYSNSWSETFSKETEDWNESETFSSESSTLEYSNSWSETFSDDDTINWTESETFSTQIEQTVSTENDDSTFSIENKHLKLFIEKTESEVIRNSQLTQNLFTPFFLIEGTGQILINETDMDYTYNFLINSKTNLTTLFKSIKSSPYEKVSLIIQEKINTDIIIGSDLFVNRSFSIISNVANYIVYFKNCDYKWSKYQYIKNIQIHSINKLTFSNVTLVSCSIYGEYKIKNLTIDSNSLSYGKNSPYDSFFNHSETVNLQFYSNSNISLFVQQQKLQSGTQTFYLDSIRMKKLNLITFSNLTIISNSNYIKLNYDIQIILYTTNSNRIQIIFKNFIDDSIDLLHHFSINANSIPVDIQTVGFKFPFPNPISFSNHMSVFINSMHVLFSDRYCICDSNSKHKCNEICKPDNGPIIPFDSNQIDHTVEFHQTKFLNYTIYGSTNDNRPTFDLSLYNSTSFNICSYKNAIEYISINNSDKRPKENSNSTFSNLNIHVETNLNLYSATFRSVEFSIPKRFLNLATFSLDSDINTLFNFPSKFHLLSPTISCKIYCYSIIHSILISNEQTIELISESDSFLLYINKLNSSPTIIQSDYGRSIYSPLRVYLTNSQPKNLAEIPDILINITDINETRYIEFPDRWNQQIEDASSRFEILHMNLTLYVQGKFVDDVYTTIPPTIFHHGDGPFFVNGVFSTFQLKYCLCDVYTTNCSTVCNSIGPVISFNQYDIIKTIKSNPTRHITYVIMNSSINSKPYFRLIDFSVKSFTLCSEKDKLQYIDLETNNETPVVPLNHRFLFISIHPVMLSCNDLLFYNLEIQNSLVEWVNGLSLKQIGLKIDLETAIELTKVNLLSPAKSLTLIGKKTLVKIVVLSKYKIDLFNSENQNAIFDLSQLSQPILITTLIGDKNNSMIHVELPSYSITINDFPLMKLDLTQITGDLCYLMFPTSRWIGELANLTEKLTVDASRHDLYEESSQHDNKYDGVPPIINVIGSGRYYINGILFDPSKPMEPPKPNGDNKFKKLGTSEIAGIVLGSIGLLVLIAGIVIIFIRRKKERKSVDENSSKIVSLIDIDDHLL